MVNKALTKRQLGLFLLAGGMLGFIAILAIDLVDMGREGGIGPAQQIALGLMLALTVVGVSLIPIKDQPA